MSKPTPRTDSAIMEIPSKFDSICVVPVELALDLERELGDALRDRDEAREDAEHWKTEYKIVADRLRGKKHERDNGIIAEDEIIPKLTKERDEARERERVAWNAFDEERQRASREGERVWEARRERDEARKQGAMWKSNHDNQVALKAMLMDRPDLGDRASRISELIRERDEVREAIKSTIDWCAERRNAPDHTTLGMVEERLRQALEETNE